MLMLNLALILVVLQLGMDAEFVPSGSVDVDG